MSRRTRKLISVFGVPVFVLTNANGLLLEGLYILYLINFILIPEKNNDHEDQRKNKMDPPKISGGKNEG